MTSSNIMDLRREVRTWLDENVPTDLPIPIRGEDISSELEKWIQDFRPKLGEKGWLAPNWPSYFGGGGYSPSEGDAILEEVGKTRIPPLGINKLWLFAMRVWGTEEQKGKWLPPSLRGEIDVFQILSEPTGGSDLAHQDTVAIRHDDRFFVNGEKGYTTAQMTPDHLFILTVSDPEGERYENLSMLIIDASDAGVSYKKRNLLMGGTQRSWIIKDVWVPGENVVGEIGKGWTVAQTILDLERGGTGVDKNKQQEVMRREKEYWEKVDEPDWMKHDDPDDPDGLLKK